MALAVCAALAPTPIPAGIHTCPTASGGTQFQDRPCDRLPDTAQTDRSALRQADDAAARWSRPAPAGIDESWFERPSEIPYEALCDSKGCECGAMRLVFKAGLPIAIADALYLDGAWYRYEASVQAWRDASTSTESFAARTEVEDSACDVLMAQRTLMLFADSTIASLARRARDAEDLGRDTVESCDGFSENACQDFESYMLFQRLTIDLEALSDPRVSLFDR